jgi:RNA polymerase sigma-70 factor (ECF subfamily)
MNDPGRPPAESLLELLEERQHLLEIALWIFDSDLAADRIVQETYRRWYALEDDVRAAVALPWAWLTRTTGAICLELLSSAASITSLESSAPVVRSGGARLVRSVQTGQLVQSSAKATVRRHARVVHRFADACQNGDPSSLQELLATDVIVVSDGGGKVRAPVLPVQGATDAAHFVCALLCGQQRVALTVETVNGRAGLALRQDGQALAVVSVSVTREHVTAVWITLNPDKLRSWHRC